MYSIAIAVVAMLGGSIIIELPADKKIAEFKVKVAEQFAEVDLLASSEYDRRENQYNQQQVYHAKKEIEDIDRDMRSASEEINRLNRLPDYLNRALNTEEQWLLETEKTKWNALQQERVRLTQ